MGLSSISNDQDLAQETIDVEAEGESGTIAFNYHYIFGCLNALSKEKEITLELKSYSQAWASSSPTTRSTTCTWSCRSASSNRPMTMFARDLSVAHYRSFDSYRLALDEGVTILAGPNAAGKDQSHRGAAAADERRLV